MDRLPVGSRIVITRGDLRGNEGTLQRLDDAGGMATVRLTLFGRDVGVQVPRSDLSTDLAGYRARQLEARRQEYRQWRAATCQKLGLPADSASIPPEMVGTYFNPGVGTSGLRLTLAEDGMLLVEMWADLGGSWLALHDGFFLVDDGVVRTDVTDLAFSNSSFATNGLLHIRDVNEQVVLVPCSTLEELDEVLRDMPANIERLQDSFLGLKLFFKDDAAE